MENITTQTVPGKKLLFTVSLFYKSQGKKYVKSTTYTIEMLEPFPFPPVPKDAEHSRWFAGDVHIHSNYTDCDPWPYYGTLTISEIKTNAISAGMNWTVITDHAYCLSLTTYEQIQQETTSVSDSTYACLFGEELSVRELKINDSGCGYTDQDTAGATYTVVYANLRQYLLLCVCLDCLKMAEGYLLPWVLLSFFSLLSSEK